MKNMFKIVCWSMQPCAGSVLKKSCLAEEVLCAVGIRIQALCHRIQIGMDMFSDCVGPCGIHLIFIL